MTAWIIPVRQRDLLHRDQIISKLLSPLAPERRRPACARWLGAGKDRFILAAHDGSPSQTSYRDWRFPTVARGLYGNYFEVWDQPIPGRDDVWYLTQAYLNIYVVGGSQGIQPELVCLHCDPNEEARTKHWKYKRGPHIHVKAARSPIPDAHIALRLSDIDEVLASATTITEAFKEAIAMLKDEVFAQLVEAVSQKL